MELNEVIYRIRAELVRLILRLTHKLVPKLIKFFNYRGVKLFIPEGIFNPVFTLSASLIMDNVKPQGLVIDLGCGSGILSIYAALNSRVRSVYAYDVNVKALAVTLVNSRMNDVDYKVKVLHNIRDLTNIRADYVLVNPPYLPLTPRDSLDINWCCGELLECIEELLSISLSLLSEDGTIFITFSSLTNIRRLAKIIKRYDVKFKVITYRRTPIDTMYLALIKPTVRSR